VPESPPHSSPAAHRVQLGTLALKNFRNYADLTLRVPARIVALTGPNGVGKTNLLEAMSLLTPGRGLRRAPYGEMARRGGNAGWAVAAVVRRAGAETRLGTGIGAAPEDGGGRKVRVNGASAPVEELLEHLRVLWLTPAMDGLFTGPAGDRRRFLDRLVLTVDPGHGRRAREFESLLSQRNRLLEEGAASGWLDAVEAQLAERAVAMALARAETVTLLCARLLAGGEEGAFPAGRIALAGDFDRAIAGRPASEAELWYRGALAAGRAADRAAKRTLEGPHRSDLDVLFAAKAMPAALSSTGEQKALLIGLILAHARLVSEVVGMTPVLLLDEVAAHLDPSRREALLTRLDALGCQAFLTGTDSTLFAGGPESATILRVAQDGILPMEEPVS
jgi:DNA replication and repair protein RecF